MDFRILGPLEVLDGDRPRGASRPAAEKPARVLAPPRQPGRLVGPADRGALARRGAGVRARRRCRRASRGFARRSAPAPRCSSPRRPATSSGSTANNSTSAASSGSSRRLLRPIPPPLPSCCGRRSGSGVGLRSPISPSSRSRRRRSRASRSLRLLAVERRIDADLALGQHAQLVPELEALVAEHPLREGLLAQLMLAQYRAGRQAEALEHYRRARRDAGRRARDRPEPRAAGARAGHPAPGPLARARARAHRAALDPRRRSSPVEALEPLLALAEPLARKPEREIILARVLGRIAPSSAERQLP